MERSSSARHSVLTPRFRKAQESPKAHAGGAEAKHGNSSSPSNKSYFNSPTLLLRPRTANKEFQRKMSPLARGTSRRSQSATGQDYDQFMQMRFHSFLARKHAASGKQPVQLVNIQPESDLKVPPRDAVTPLVALHRAAAKLDSATAAASPRSPARRLRVKSAQKHGLPNTQLRGGQWHTQAQPLEQDETQLPSQNSVKPELTEELLEQALGSLAEYLDGQENLADAPGAPHRTVLTYLRRCLYSDRPTSAVTTAEQEAGEISFIPYFQVVATQDKTIKDLKSKYDTRTRKNRDLLERIAGLEKERDDLQNKLADQQYQAAQKGKQVKRINRDLQVTQASYLGMAEEFRKLQSRCATATAKMHRYKQKYEAALVKHQTLELAHSGGNNNNGPGTAGSSGGDGASSED